MSALPKVGVFKHPTRAACLENTSLIKGAVADEVKALKQQKGDPLRCIGSIRLVKSLVKLGLVDRFRLMVFPLMLGENGKEPIDADYPRLPLELVHTAVLDSRLLLLDYRPPVRVR
jgi:dihydrofolate reductase